LPDLGATHSGRAQFGDATTQMVSSGANRSKRVLIVGASVSASPVHELRHGLTAHSELSTDLTERDASLAPREDFFSFFHLSKLSVFASRVNVNRKMTPGGVFGPISPFPAPLRTKEYY
jgi:hypothetical protein